MDDTQTTVDAAQSVAASQPVSQPTAAVAQAPTAPLAASPAEAKTPDEPLGDTTIRNCLNCGYCNFPGLACPQCGYAKPDKIVTREQIKAALAQES